MQSIAERVKIIRKHNKLNQQEFANILGLSQTHISKIESGKDNPSDKALRTIAVEFSINFEWLKNGVGDMNSSNTLGDKHAMLKDCNIRLQTYLQSCGDLELLFCASHVLKLPEFFDSLNYLDQYKGRFGNKLSALLRMNEMLVEVVEYVEYINTENEKLMPLIASGKNIMKLQDKYDEMNHVKDRYKLKIADTIEKFFGSLIEAKDIDEADELQNKATE